METRNRNRSYRSASVPDPFCPVPEKKPRRNSETDTNDTGDTDNNNVVNNGVPNDDDNNFEEVNWNECVRTAYSKICEEHQDWISQKYREQMEVESSKPAGTSRWVCLENTTGSTNKVKCISTIEKRNSDNPQPEVVKMKTAWILPVPLALINQLPKGYIWTGIKENVQMRSIDSIRTHIPFFDDAELDIEPRSFEKFLIKRLEAVVLNLKETEGKVMDSQSLTELVFSMETAKVDIELKLNRALVSSREAMILQRCTSPSLQTFEVICDELLVGVTVEALQCRYLWLTREDALNKRPWHELIDISESDGPNQAELINLTTSTLSPPTDLIRTGTRRRTRELRLKQEVKLEYMPILEDMTRLTIQPIESGESCQVSQPMPTLTAISYNIQNKINGRGIKSNKSRWTKVKQNTTDTTAPAPRYLKAARSRMAKYTPCSHNTSRCTMLNSQCGCAKAGTFCETDCGCDENCKNKSKPCKCVGTCDIEKCSCYLIGRECQPNKCHPDSDNTSNSTQHGSDNGMCGNTCLQKGNHQVLNLTKSKIPNAGWGVFATTLIRKNEFIYEYNGEVISSEEMEARSFVNERRNFSYIFDLNSDSYIDAAKFGNKSRFINHNDNPNTFAKALMVNGDHRVAIFAFRDIQAGEELTLEYSRVLESHAADAERRVKLQQDLVTSIKSKA